MKKTCIALLLVCLFFVKPLKVRANIFLNELVIDQTPQAAEILNNGLEPVDISSWYIDDNGGSTFFSVPSNTVIFPHSCLVFSSEFNWNKSSADVARLFDSTAPPTSSSAHLIDSYSYLSGPGGALSFSRVPDGENWGTASASLGKFNSTNESCVILPTATPTPIATPTTLPSQTPTPQTNPVASPTPTTLAVQNIFISEAMVNPTTGENEWVELYNDNDFSVNLTNWYIDDTENSGSAPKQFSLSIPAKDFASFTLSSGMFNNDADSVRLLNPEKNEVDSFEFSISEKGKSLGRTDYITDTFCNQEPSKDATNLPCLLMSIGDEEQGGSSVLMTDTESNTQSTNSSSSLVEILSVLPTATKSYKNYSSFFRPTKAPLSLAVSRQTGIVLGETTIKTNHILGSLLNSFSFSSGGLSLLVILSIILKLRLLK